jgi:hypothetical protein
MAASFAAQLNAAGRLDGRTDGAGWLRLYWPILVIIAVTFAVRGVTFGNPVLDFDEQLYLLVGDRMLQGQLPYVDLWDRKPIGLFLFYAGIRLLGGDGIVQYQVVAALMVVATSTIIWIMGRRVAGTKAALVAALSYILFLNPFHGLGGQTPVLYNLFMAIGAWACLRANDSDDPRRIFPLALLAMAMSGIAIQFKYTPVVEGILFGCYFLYRLHGSGLSLSRLATAASAMILVALAPTLAAIGYFWSVGEFDSFVYANFVSVFERRPFPDFTVRQQWQFVLIIGGPLLVLASLSAWRALRLRPDGGGRDLAFTIGWSIAALCGFCLLGDFFDHYFMSVLPPLLLLIARLIKPGRLGFIAGCFALLWPFILSAPPVGQAERSRAATRELVDALRPFVGSHCLYVYDGPTILYLLTGACAPSRYIYPDHLTNPTETAALGVDAVAEMDRILATRPGAIVTANRPMVPKVDPNTRARLKAALARDYVLVARVELDRIYDVYALRALAPGRQPLAVPFIDPI